jgi:hypothetical protein
LFLLPVDAPSLRLETHVAYLLSYLEPLSLSPTPFFPYSSNFRHFHSLGFFFVLNKKLIAKTMLFRRNLVEKWDETIVSLLPSD